MSFFSSIWASVRIFFTGSEIEPFKLRKPSAILLIFANLIPIFGVFFLDWEIFPIMILFWTQNIIVLLFTLVKMVIYLPRKLGNWLKKIYMIPYFCLHYGFFTIACGLAIFFLFRGNYQQDVYFPNITLLIQTIKHYQLIWAILAMFISHGVSFFLNYIGKGEYKYHTLNSLMDEPYRRMAIMEIAVMLAGLIMQVLGSTTITLILLIILKTYIDLSAHLTQHDKHPEIIPASSV